MNGIVNVLKPAGMSSQAVISRLKHQFGWEKAGHLGTLDPDAAGVLPICIGKATRLFDYFLNKNKVYRTVFVFGKSTTTLDSSGEVDGDSERIPSKEEILAKVSDFVGTIDQMPPKFSAKNVNGVKAYKLARGNAEFDLKPKQVTIQTFKLLEQLDENKFLFEIACSSGTYVRSLCRDLADQLDSKAYVGAIIRTASGPFTVVNASLFEEVSPEQILSLKKVLENGKKILVADEFYDKIINGVKVRIDTLQDCQDAIIYSKDELIGIADITNHTIQIKSYLKE